MNLENLTSVFSALGGIFCTKPEKLAEKHHHIKAYVFDWDGVFNNASKNENKSSTFNEADSMGTNLIRFSHYLLYKQLPVTAIISGEKNEMAMYFTQREHFNASYFKIPHKILALDHLCKQHGIKREEVCYVFDDVLDLSIAEVCGIRLLVNRSANPLFKDYLVNNGLVDYITAAESGNFAVREICELLIGLNQNYSEVMKHRTSFSETYAAYFNQRQSCETFNFTQSNNNIISQ